MYHMSIISSVLDHGGGGGRRPKPILGPQNRYRCRGAGGRIGCSRLRKLAESHTLALVLGSLRERNSVIVVVAIPSDRRWGTDEKETRQLAEALFSSMVLYGYRYYYLTKCQHNIVQNLNKEANRLIAALPKHTWLSELNAHGIINQLSRLLGTQAGQANLHVAPPIALSSTTIAPTTTLGEARQLNK